MEHQAHESEFEDEEPQIKPLTPEEAAVWRKRQPRMSMWRILGLQALMGVLVALLAWWMAGRAAGWSAAYGALAIVVPAALFARGVARN
ncbi:MAG: ATP synthase subunit I, partial [Comamonas sp.]